ncbi:MAG: lipopolysaccharide transport periplasmic protein LptA [Candidatus Rokubacteria bacterium]|nr:lipopolysaccharide transport periplasmic protein LptA [Candidatus Rokubacteria bacterium]
MKRALGALATCVVLAGLAPLDLGAQQGAQGRRRPAQEATPRQSPTKPAHPDPAAARRKSEDKGAPVTVDADRLESMQKEGLVIFTGNVVARQNNSTQYADRMEVYLDAGGDRIIRTVSSGSVRIVTKDCRTGMARRAEYHDAEQRVVLIGDARVWQEENVVTGERITIFLAEDRSVVEGGRQERVKAVFYPKREGAPGGEARSAPGAPCR